ncbi:zf-TRAF domain-containing protein, partial [Sansalvadorimonas verongulae]|uniref:hypothetical protein n=1 Tax=Sansalvadorimonas verongulae TaxID=2172824 RepID=UPI0018AD1673
MTEAKKLKAECLEMAANQPQTPGKIKEFADRMIRFYPLVLAAALKETSEPGLTTPAATTTSKILCPYQCGYKANSHKEFSSHFSECPYQPISCRHCSKTVQRKDIIDHEEECNLRPVNCTFCDEDMLLESMAEHFEYCDGYPVNCTLCHNAVPRSKLYRHKKLECLQRLVDCDRCFETCTATELNAHKQGCRFMQNM